MYLTKREARGKFCPFKEQLYLEAGNSVGISTNSLPENNCIAENCIMWRSHETDDNKGFCGMASTP